MSHTHLGLVLVLFSTCTSVLTAVLAIKLRNDQIRAQQAQQQALIQAAQLQLQRQMRAIQAQQANKTLAP
jgi:hypothetical protein